jgi:hypothetical protein
MKAARISILGWFAAAFIFCIAGAHAEPIAFENDSDRYSYAMGVHNGNLLIEQLNVSQALPPERIDTFKHMWIAGMQEAQTLPQEDVEKKLALFAQFMEKNFSDTADLDLVLKNADPELVEKIAYNNGMMTVISARAVTKQTFGYVPSIELNEKLLFAGFQDGILDKSALSESEVKQLNSHFMTMMSENFKIEKAPEK